MTYLTGGDAAYPPPGGKYPPEVKVGAFYIGGDTPHVWTTDEITEMATTVDYLLPVYVRSNPGNVSAQADAADALSRLAVVGAPATCLVALDIETSDDPAYVAEFKTSMGQHPVVVYGSAGNLFQASTPPYWVALPGAVAPDTSMTGTEGTQYQWDQSYDLTWWDEAFIEAHAWPVKPTTPPPHSPYRHVSNGAASLEAIAADRHTTVQHLIDLTLANTDDANRQAFIHYLAAQVMPLGLVYYTSNP